MSKLLRNVSANRFNQRYTIGARFCYYPVVGIPDCVEVVTETQAWEMCGRTVVKVTGRIGGVSVRNLEPVTVGQAKVSAAILDVLTERERQLNVLGLTPELDDRYTEGEMSDAAICYINPFLADGYWPWSGGSWKPSDRRRNLIKGAALLLAEIERVDRLASGGAA